MAQEEITQVELNGHHGLISLSPGKLKQIKLGKSTKEESATQREKPGYQQSLLKHGLAHACRKLYEAIEEILERIKRKNP